MKTNLKLISLVVLTAMVAACSVEQKTVKNNPPPIPERTTSFKNKTGRMKLESLTVFLWPAFPSELAAEDAIAKVNKASKAIDLLTIDFVKLAQNEALKQKEFEELDCLALADTDDEDPGDVSDWVNKWKSVPPDDQKGTETLRNCILNQDTRKSLAETKAEINAKQAGHLKEIVGTIDPEGTGNWKKTNPRQSRLEFKRGAGGLEVSIQLKDFAVVGNNQSTDAELTTIPEGRITDVVYDEAGERNVLTFKVPEIVSVEQEVVDPATGEKTKEEKLVPTGAVYHFVLERSNFLHFAKFAGDVKLVYPNGKSKLGSASLYGSLKGE